MSEIDVALREAKQMNNRLAGQGWSPEMIVDGSAGPFPYDPVELVARMKADGFRARYITSGEVNPKPIKWLSSPTPPTKGTTP